MKKKIVPKSKSVVKEAADIVINSDDDSAAIEFLRDTLEDDFPDLDLGRMDLHEAIQVLGGDEVTPKKKDKAKGFDNINKALEMFTGRNKKSSRKSSRRKRK